MQNEHAKPQGLGFLPTWAYWKQNSSTVGWQKAGTLFVAISASYAIGLLAISDFVARSIASPVIAALLSVVIMGIVERWSRKRPVVRP